MKITNYFYIKFDGRFFFLNNQVFQIIFKNNQVFQIFTQMTNSHSFLHYVATWSGDYTLNGHKLPLGVRLL